MASGEENIFGSFSYLGSIEITKSLCRVEYGRQSTIIRAAIQKFITARLTENTVSRPSLTWIDQFIGNIYISSEHSCDIKIIENMIHVTTRGAVGGLRLCHHLNCISLSMIDNAIENLFCYLANGSIKTRGQAFETVSNPNRQLYIFQCASKEQAFAIGTAMDRRFKPKSCNRPQLGANPYLNPYSNQAEEKIQIPIDPIGYTDLGRGPWT